MSLIRALPVTLLLAALLLLPAGPALAVPYDTAMVQTDDWTLVVRAATVGGTVACTAEVTSEDTVMVEILACGLEFGFQAGSGVATPQVSTTWSHTVHPHGNDACVTPRLTTTDGTELYQARFCLGGHR